MSLKFGVVVFPGSNCDHDAYYSLKKVLGYDVEFLWHKETDLRQSSVILLPGGFSYGDYLRTGAIARFSPIMNSVISFANKGGIVIGICNGFQILLEAGLLPGVMIRNNSLKFACKDVYLKTENRETIFSAEISEATKALKIPIAHGEGNYFADIELLKELEANKQILFRYSDEDGNVNDESNPNGSRLNIAGIVNKNGNVMGMMPHPERACDPTLGRTDGQLIFKSIANYILN
ncbi:MAG: phosphoribosylformylglycinamidine synthase subunit PurQ [Ignavibacteriaceae bacterium]|jgi:phosphoribosylformylglycinamidine synthase|nr:phosphoribosylformylglycinamidine synthase subunit PurQ [Ignavibacterium sp.]MCC6256157.1 phosphoribosylformylglycinamidine synthase subunit PurQ [Ignavibacteriaceae bacterium]HRN27673.1 phosphoribosylformylglycinamidine synthase subunit PurQ [Ignavibacteriaceae bacterium]HRP94067.1 phosphoribosylformylglycinamidine synthase subunit PurQ [Ignavibacteriaceae bacterium]HRQ55367.1 phosphoribosylformylglycinamidine synthase subunit PurQ [Ignavibacteriaceae bacterium]